MKNHFFISYAGNKRNEIEEIYNNIDFTDIKTIIEPFCGTCAMSYYISQKQPGIYKYVLNDNNDQLINLMKIIKSKRKTKIFQNKINKLIFDKNKKFISKEKYVELVKKNDIYGWFIGNKYYNIRGGLYPFDQLPTKLLDLEEYPMTQFLRNENIIISCGDGSSFIDKYKDDKTCLLLMDPPYLFSENGFYKKPCGNVYQNIYELIKNKYEFKAKIIFCLEYIWIIDAIFNSWNIIQYNKKYQPSKKNTIHAIIKNF